MCQSGRRSRLGKAWGSRLNSTSQAGTQYRLKRRLMSMSPMGTDLLPCFHPHKMSQLGKEMQDLEKDSSVQVSKTVLMPQMNLKQK